MPNVQLGPETLLVLGGQAGSWERNEQDRAVPWPLGNSLLK